MDNSRKKPRKLSPHKNTLVCIRFFGLLFHLIEVLSFRITILFQWFQKKIPTTRLATIIMTITIIITPAKNAHLRMKGSPKRQVFCFILDLLREQTIGNPIHFWIISLVHVGRSSTWKNILVPPSFEELLKAIHKEFPLEGVSIPSLVFLMLLLV